LGISLKGLQNAIKTGRVSIQHQKQAGTKIRYLFDIEKARAEFESTRTRGSRATRGESGALPATDGQPSAIMPGNEPDEPAAVPENVDSGDEPDLLTNPPGDPTPKDNYKLNPNQKAILDAKANRELYNSKTAELDYKIKSGEYVSIEKVKTLFSEIAVIVKQNMLSIPDRISSILAAEDEEKKIHKILSAELKQALKEMSSGRLSLEMDGK